MKNILITGLPGIGKTTLLLEIINELEKEVTGFVTKELRESNRRIGFEIESFSGNKLLLASKKNRESRYRVASYGVFVENVDIIVDELNKNLQKEKYDLIVLDEIGKMELFSSKFKSFVMDCLEEKKVFGTIMLRDNEFSRKIKERKDTSVFEITISTREKIKNKVKELLK